LCHKETANTNTGDYGSLRAHYGLDNNGELLAWIIFNPSDSPDTHESRNAKRLKRPLDLPIAVMWTEAEETHERWYAQPMLYADLGRKTTESLANVLR